MLDAVPITALSSLKVNRDHSFQELRCRIRSADFSPPTQTATLDADR